MGTPSTEALALLAGGAVTVKGRMPWSSNATFLVQVDLDETQVLAIYKPARGERPLWDFPSGLFKRELGAWLLSETLGWGLVPPTIVRDEAPFGRGALQLFIEADFEQHYFTLHENPAHHERLMRICVFDLVANNADRKSGHCLLGRDGLIYAIDNGLCFHVEPKLRTVIWEFGGMPIPASLLADLRRLTKAGLPEELAEILTPAERKTLLARTRRVVEMGEFPAETGGHRYPWPLV